MARPNPMRIAAYRGGQLVDGAEPVGGEWPIMLDGEALDAKPDGAQVAAISKRIASAGGVMETTAGLARALSMGQTVQPGICEGGRKDADWERQRLYFVDVDNDAAQDARGWRPLGEYDAVYRAYAYGMPLLMSYQTFSGTDMARDPDVQRYRLVFAAPSTIADRDAAAEFSSAVLAAYPEADRSSSQLARMFYGTDKEVSVWA